MGLGLMDRPAVAGVARLVHPQLAARGAGVLLVLRPHAVSLELLLGTVQHEVRMGLCMTTAADHASTVLAHLEISHT